MLEDLAFLSGVQKLYAELHAIIAGQHVPPALANRPEARAYADLYASLTERLGAPDALSPEACAEAALALDDALRPLKIVDWTGNPEVMKAMRSTVDDHVLERALAHGLQHPTEAVLDAFQEDVLATARRYAT